jgi:MFS family permease
MASAYSDPRNTPYNRGFIVFVSIVGSIGGFLFGYDTGIIAGAQLYFKDTWPEITTVERELIVSLALLGAFFGSLIAGPFSDSFGRKPVILASDVLFTIGSLVMATAETIPILILGRLIVGLAVGVASMVVPVYLSEVAPIKIRGTVVTCFLIALTFG